MIPAFENVTPLAVGATKSECTENAVAKLKAVYKAAQAPMVMVQAKDGTIYVARWIDESQMEYWIWRNGERGGGCVGTCQMSLQRYMAQVVADYDACTQPSIPTLDERLRDEAIKADSIEECFEINMKRIFA